VLLPWNALQVAASSVDKFHRQSASVCLVLTVSFLTVLQDVNGRNFHDLLRESSSSLLILFGRSSMSVALLFDHVHVSQFFGQPTGILQLNVMAQICSILCPGCFIQIR
jgi:hypothetical protein